jgi:hypothetical protein
MLELVITRGVKDNPSSTLFELPHQRFLVDVNSSLIRLLKFLETHVMEHGTNALVNSVVHLPDAAHSSLAVSSHDINGLDGRKLLRIGEIRN